MSKGSGGWSLFGGSDEKFWDAARLFKEAAQAYERQGQSAPSLPPLPSAIFTPKELSTLPR